MVSNLYFMYVSKDLMPKRIFFLEHLPPVIAGRFVGPLWKCAVTSRDWAAEAQHMITVAGWHGPCRRSGKWSWSSCAPTPLVTVKIFCLAARLPGPSGPGAITQAASAKVLSMDQRTDQRLFGESIIRACLFPPKNSKFFKIPSHIKSLNAYMEY